MLWCKIVVFDWFCFTTEKVLGVFLLLVVGCLLSVLDTIFWQKSLELTGDGCRLSVVGSRLLVLDTIF